MTDSGELTPYGSSLSSPTVVLTQAFYEWERRGRGYQVWSYPVELEPSFVPFYGHYEPQSTSFTDDTQKPTFLSSIAESIKEAFNPQNQDHAAVVDAEDLPPAEEPPELCIPPGDIIEFQLALPVEYKSTPGLMEQLLLSLSYMRYPLIFEVIGTSEEIGIQLSCFEEDGEHVFDQLCAFVPEGVIVQRNGYLEGHWDSSSENNVVVDFGLSQESMLPLSVSRNFDVDPLIGITAALSNLKAGEVGVLQILCQAVRNQWTESLMRSVTDWDGSAFFADAPEMIPLTRQKIAKPLFATIVRVGASANTQERAWQTVKRLGSALTQFTNPPGNALIPLENDGYPEDVHAVDLINRHTHRSGMLLNSEELVSLMHLPHSSVQIPKLLRITKRTKAAPEISHGHQLIIGENEHRGLVQRVTLSPQQRMRHMYTIGASGTGKTTLLLNMIIQDMRNGEGIAVLDPHGDLIDTILRFVPEERIDDVVLFDPSDEEFPVGFNILEAHSELEKTLLASDLVAIFRRLSTSWGDQMNSVLANGILAMLESDEPGTLMTLRRFLVDPDFRKKFLPSVKDPEIRFYWEKEYPLLGGRPQAPVLTRLDTFLRPKPIRHMVAQSKNKIDFSTILNGGKIFLAKLAHGGIGEENSYLLGAFLVSKLNQMAIARQKIPEQERRNFYCYIDEFQNFITPSMESILSGARKYGLGLILAHQELRQIEGKDRQIAASVIANPYTRVCFRMGDSDARKLASGFSYFDENDMQSLGIGEAIGRIEQAAYDFNLSTFPLPNREEEGGDIAQQVIAQSRQRYGTPKKDVEELIAQNNERYQTAQTSDQQVVSSQKDVPPDTILEPEKATSPVNESENKPPVQKKTPGRGGSQHKYLQELIKRIAQERGYKATIEQSVHHGAGSVDVSLEGNGEKIACEISVTTDVKQEIANVEKCLSAGYDTVLVLSDRKTHLNKIRKALVETLDDSNQAKIQYLLPDDFVLFLEKQSAQLMDSTKKIRGYTVNVKYQSVSSSEQKAKRDAVARVIMQSMKRMKE